MHRIVSLSSIRQFSTRIRRGVLSVLLTLAVAPVFAVDGPVSVPADTASASSTTLNAVEPIVSKSPMELQAEEGGAHGQLPVARELLGTEGGDALLYSITAEPQHGRVGLAGGDEGTDFFANKSSRSSYFAYRSETDYAGMDSFSYRVRNETTGLVFENTVVITVKPPLLELDKVQVSGIHEHTTQDHQISLMTRPNQPITHKVPSHEDFLKQEDRVGMTEAKVAYLLDDKSKPQHGTVKLDRTSGQLTYAPNPGFIGDDQFGYYTVDENNSQFGMDSVVTIKVEPIRNVKHLAVDRSLSRQVDLVFVINNSPSMAAHQIQIADNLKRFRQLFHERDLDYRIGVLTTDFVNADPGRRPEDQPYFKEVRSVQLDKLGNPVLDRNGRPKQGTKRVASNGTLVTLPVMDQPWITSKTPDSIFAELVKVGTNGDSNRTAFTSVYNFVVGYYNKQHAFLRPDATTFVVFFMDEEETRMALWKENKDGTREAQWIEDGKLPDLLNQYNASHPDKRQTLDGYINNWVLRPFIIVKGNKRGNVEMHAVVSPGNLSHRRAAELTGGTVLNIETDFSSALAALGDRIADTVAVALEPVQGTATLYKKSFRVLVDGQEVAQDPQNGYVYDELTHSIRFQGAAKKKAFAAKIDITYEEHL